MIGSDPESEVLHKMTEFHVRPLWPDLDLGRLLMVGVKPVELPPTAGGLCKRPGAFLEQQVQSPTQHSSGQQGTAERTQAGPEGFFPEH